MDAASKEEVILAIRRALAEYARDKRAKARHKHNFDEEYEALVAEYAPLNDELDARIKASIDLIVSLAAEHYSMLFSKKTLRLREGTLSVRKATSFNFDAKKVEAWLRDHKRWWKYSLPQPRKINKPMIEEDEALVAQLPDELASFSTVERLTIKNTDPQIDDIKEDLPPARREVETPDASN